MQYMHSLDNYLFITCTLKPIGRRYRYLYLIPAMGRGDYRLTHG